MNNDNCWNPNLYNEKHAFVYNYGERLIELLQPKENERILDLGCGSGQLTSKIFKIASEVIGMDKSPEMIADAQSKFPEIEFVVGDASDFNFDKKFDAIFSNATLHWVLDVEQSIKCMYENMNSTGRLVVEFGGKGNVQTIVEQLRISLRNRGFIKHSELKVWYFPSIAEYTNALESEGFRVLSAEHFDRPTELADEQSGIKDWISMFADSFFVGLDPEIIEEIKAEVQENVKESCLINGKWFADYKRIRFVAVKE